MSNKSLLECVLNLGLDFLDDVRLEGLQLNKAIVVFLHRL